MATDFFRCHFFLFLAKFFFVGLSDFFCWTVRFFLLDCQDFFRGIFFTSKNFARLTCPKFFILEIFLRLKKISDSKFPGRQVRNFWFDFLLELSELFQADCADKNKYRREFELKHRKIRVAANGKRIRNRTSVRAEA